MKYSIKYMMQTLKLEMEKLFTKEILSFLIKFNMIGRLQLHYYRQHHGSIALISLILEVHLVQHTMEI